MRHSCLPPLVRLSLGQLLSFGMLVRSGLTISIEVLPLGRYPRVLASSIFLGILRPFIPTRRTNIILILSTSSSMVGFVDLCLIRSLSVVPVSSLRYSISIAPNLLFLKISLNGIIRIKFINFNCNKYYYRCKPQENNSIHFTRSCLNPDNGQK